MRYAVIIEEAGAKLSACVPDLPGSVAPAGMLAEVQQAIAEAAELHLQGLRDDGLAMPDPSMRAE